MEDNEKLLCQVLGSVSGQMRGSMANIHAALRHIKAAATEGGDEKYTAILTQSYYRLLRIMDNLSAAPLLADEKIGCDPQADMAAWLEELVRQAQPLAEEQGLTLTFRTAAVCCDLCFNHRLMELLVWNLLSNAMKFTPAGGRIDVSLEARSGQVLLTVADNGCGISPEMMDIVYERYLHPERLDPLPCGLGLGLPLCRRIAEGHNGRFLLTSREGRGTTVTVALPCDGVPETLRDVAVDTGFQPVMVGLSDALSYRSFTRKNLDE